MPPTLLSSTRITIAAVLSSLLASTLSVTSKAAAVTPLSSYREVATFGSLLLEGQMSGPFEIDERPSDELGSFDDTASTDLDFGETFVAASATQTSHWGTTQFAFDATFTCEAGLGAGDRAAEGFGDAVAVVHFQVDEATTAIFAGWLTASGNGNSNLVLETAESTILLALGGANGSFPIDESRVLAPGVYVLRCVTGGYGRQFPGMDPSPAAGSITATVTFSTSTSAPVATPGTDAVIALHPNPLRGAASILLGRSNPRGTDVRVFDARGRLVRTLGPAFAHSIQWDGRDDSGAPLAPGVYFVRAGDGPAVRATIVR